MQHACSLCAAVGAEFACSACLSVAYCSASCQKQHWTEDGHAGKCVGLTNIGAIYPEPCGGLSLVTRSSCRNTVWDAVQNSVLGTVLASIADAQQRQAWTKLYQTGISQRTTTNGKKSNVRILLLVLLPPAATKPPSFTTDEERAVFLAQYTAANVDAAVAAAENSTIADLSTDPLPPAITMARQIERKTMTVPAIRPAKGGGGGDAQTTGHVLQFTFMRFEKKRPRSGQWQVAWWRSDSTGPPPPLPVNVRVGEAYKNGYIYRISALFTNQ
jgi:hypothetical protein